MFNTNISVILNSYLPLHTFLPLSPERKKKNDQDTKLYHWDTPVLSFQKHTLQFSYNLYLAEMIIWNKLMKIYSRP